MLTFLSPFASTCVDHPSPIAGQPEPFPENECGNARTVYPEVCDDGNTHSGDGCAHDCGSVELGWTCSGGTISSPAVCIGAGCPALVVACSNADGTSHSPDATRLGVIGTRAEITCWEGFGWPGSGAPVHEATCVGVAVGRAGWDSDVAGVDACVPLCGDERVVAGEGCDDGNLHTGDGCDATCAVEAGFACSSNYSSPSVCVDADACNSVTPTANPCAAGGNSDLIGRLKSNLFSGDALATCVDERPPSVAYTCVCVGPGFAFVGGTCLR
jgi:cysteine-rich repeat protein